MGLILDTCVFIAAEKNNLSVDFAAWENYGDAFISAITVSELMIGVHRANSESRRLKRSAFVEAVISKLPVLEFTLEAARIHAEIYSYLAENGKMIGAHDLIIAATALSHGFPVLTGNGHEFSRVPGLEVLNLM